MDIAVVGLGYVGLVTATCLARLGQRVHGLESDPGKLTALERGEIPFYEPGLASAFAEQHASGALSVTSDPVRALSRADAVLICVGTPSRRDGDADLSAVSAVVDSVAEHLETPAVIALRSTVPVGTTRRMEARLNQRLRRGRAHRSSVPVIANPEFLRTGRAMEDFLHPSRVVLGHTDQANGEAIDLLANLYRPLEAPILVLDAESAELVKNAANAYLATRISFINELAGLCEATGASIERVIEGIASDPRIGADYLRPGIGYGGSCLPKDVRSLMAIGRAAAHPMHLARAVDRVNQQQPVRAAERLAEALGGLEGARVALLGLAFKPDTDDIRDSPALSLARVLHDRGAEVIGCDPAAGARAGAAEPWLRVVADPSSATEGADAVVLSTEWPAFVTADFEELAGRMRRRVLFDARNVLDPARVEAAGLTYLGVGRASPPSPLYAMERSGTIAG